jgi:hypothetical protein
MIKLPLNVQLRQHGSCHVDTLDSLHLFSKNRPLLSSCAWLPDFFSYMAIKYYKLPQTIPNGHKIYQMAVKLDQKSYNIPTSSIARPSKIYTSGLKIYHLATVIVRQQNIDSCHKSSCHCNKQLVTARSCHTKQQSRQVAAVVSRLLHQTVVNNSSFQ